MTERNHESLSALMDGEAEELEFRRILTQQDTAETDAKWRRYHLAREAMSSEQAVFHLDISARVSDVIEQEAGHAVAEPVKKKSSQSLSWLRPVSGFAVAASVAAAVVVGVRGLDGASPTALPQNLNTAPQVALNRAYPAMGSQTMSAVAGGQAVSDTRIQPYPSAEYMDKQQVQQRMDRYLLRHTQQMSTANNQGMISFARVASFETE